MVGSSNSSLSIDNKWKKFENVKKNINKREIYIFISCLYIEIYMYVIMEIYMEIYVENK